MILACERCGAAKDWSLDRVGNQPIMMSNCRHCTPGAAWYHEPIEVLYKPRGRAGLWPAASDAPLAPVDVSEV